MAELDRDKVRKDFAEAVNMTAAELKKWLSTKESRSVGWKGEDGRGIRPAPSRAGACQCRDVPLALLAHELGQRSVEKLEPLNNMAVHLLSVRMHSSGDITS
jgi:hypothetical protein